MFRTIRAAVVPLCLAIALLIAPSSALAQDEADFSDDTFDLPTYPGPFSTTSDDIADDSADVSGNFSQGLADQVLGQTVDNSDDADIERSIDDTSRDLGNSFVAPDIQPSSDPGAAANTGGTGGGLAVTGSDVEPILAISAGLLAVGGSVLVSSRRRIRDIFS